MRARTRIEEHVGEWQVRLSADSLEELFAELARVVAHRCGRSSGQPGPWERVTLESHDVESLLVDWANELLGRSEVAQCAYDEIRLLSVGTSRLDAEVRGRHVASWRSSLKAATYHGVTIGRRGRRWWAVVLFDV